MCHPTKINSKQPECCSSPIIGIVVNSGDSHNNKFIMICATHAGTFHWYMHL